MPVKTEYIIEILKQGDGATQAQADFQKVGTAAAAAKTQVAGFGSTVGMSTAEAATKTREAQRVIVSSLHLIAFSAFPEVAGAATVTTASFHAVRASAALLGVGLTAVSGIFVALGAAVWTTVSAIRAWKAEILGAQSENDLIAANGRLIAAYREKISVMENLGLLSAEQAARLQTEVTMARARAETATEESKALGLVAQQLIEVQTQENKRIKFSAEVQKLSDELLLASLAGHEREKVQANITFQERTDHIDRLSEQEAISAEQRDVYSNRALQAYGLELDAINRQIEAEKKRGEAAVLIGQVVNQANQQFAVSHSRFIVDSIRQGRFEIRAFAAEFTAALAQMILQTLIFNSIKKGLSLIGGLAAEGETWGKGGSFFDAAGGVHFAALGGVFPRVMADGGLTFAANGIPGVMTVSQPTLFRNFNTVAGEVPGQPEMLTVLSRPRMMEVGGIQAAVGNAAGHRLAITGADDLARAGGAGHIVIELRAQPGYEARIIHNSVQNARVVVVRDMGEDSELSKATRRLVS
jgi:hypothetical protein